MVLVDGGMPEVSGQATLVVHDGRSFAVTFEARGDAAIVTVGAPRLVATAPEAAVGLAINLCRKLYDVRELPVLEAGAVLTLPCAGLVMTCRERVIGIGERVELDRNVGVRVVQLRDRSSSVQFT